MKSSSHWKSVGLRPHHGICLPLSSLRTKQSSGVGEFLDLLLLIEWCSDLGFDCLQLLPLNDTGYDPSFFNPISSCALNPIYLSLAALPNPQEELSAFAHYNTLPRLAYKEVLELKIEWLFRYFQKNYSLVANTPEYLAFLSNNPWLNDYAAFKALKDAFQRVHWKHWPGSYGTLQPDPIRAQFYSFVQYYCFLQMETVRKKATEMKLFLKGDMPILLSPDSADVWANPSLFRLDSAAGAPPDVYNVLGQKWGFPLYNWEAMRHSQFAWWTQRLAILARFYHLYRIDHVVGFFRIWAIPEDKLASEGSFIPSDPQLWIPQGQEILEKFLELCPLLPIAEDLGTIPKEIYPVLKNLGICGTKVLRWQKRTEAEGDFIPYEQYESFSMTTVSGADLDPLPLWWKKFPQESMSFAKFKHWKYQPELSADRQLEILRDSHHTNSYFHINPLQEYLFAFPELVWPDPEEERINIPGTQLPSNWTYRFRPYLEDLVKHLPLQEAIRAILENR